MNQKDESKFTLGQTFWYQKDEEILSSVVESVHISIIPIEELKKNSSSMQTIKTVIYHTENKTEINSDDVCLERSKEELVCSLLKNVGKEKLIEELDLSPSDDDEKNYSISTEFKIGDSVFLPPTFNNLSVLEKKEICRILVVYKKHTREVFYFFDNKRNIPEQDVGIDESKVYKKWILKNI